MPVAPLVIGLALLSGALAGATPSAPTALLETQTADVVVHPLPWRAAPSAATFTVALGFAMGDVLAWPPDAPRVIVRADQTWTLTVDGETWPIATQPVDGRLRWLTVRLDGAAGRVDALLDGRPVMTRHRAPFDLPAARWVASGPAVGEVGPIAAWPAARPTDQLRADALIADGERPAPIEPRVRLQARRGLGERAFGCARFAPDGRWLVGCRSSLLVVFDRVAGARTRATFAHLEPITEVDVDPAGRWIATASLDGEVALWDAQTGERAVSLPHPGPARAVRFSPDGRWLATWSARPLEAADRPHWLRLWPVGRPGEAQVMTLPAAPFDARWAPRGSPRLALLDRAGALTLHAPAKPTRAIPLARPARQIAWTPDAAALVVGDAEGGVQLIASATPGVDPARARTLIEPRPGDPVGAEDWPLIVRHDAPRPPDGTPTIAARFTRFGGPPWRRPERTAEVTALATTEARIAVGFADGQIAVLGSSGRPIARFTQSAPVTALALTEGAHRVLTGGADGRVRWFDSDGRALGERAIRPQHAGPIGHLSLSPDQSQALISEASAPRSALWPTAGPPPAETPRPRALPWAHLAVDPTGTRALVARLDGALGGWDLTRLRPIPGLTGARPTTAVLWTPAGPVTGHSDGRVIRWDPQTGQPRWTHALHPPGPDTGGPAPVGGISALVPGPAGTYVAVGDAAISVIDAAGDTVKRRVELPERNLRLSAPTADDRGRVLIGGLTGLMRVDPQTGAVDRFTGPPDAPGAPWFRGLLSADGETVAAIRQMGPHTELAVWRAPGPPTTVRPLPPGINATQLAFDPQASRLAAALAHPLAGQPRAPIDSYPVQVWGLPGLEPLARLTDHRWAVTHLDMDQTGHITTGSWDGYRRRFTPDGRMIERAAGCPALAVHTGPAARPGARPTRWSLCAERIEVDRPAGRLLLLDGVGAHAGQWAIVADDVFAGSDGADALLVATRGPRLFDLDPIAAAHNRPDVIAARHGLGSPGLRADLEQRWRRRMHRLGRTIADAPATAHPTARPTVQLDAVRPPPPIDPGDPLADPVAQVTFTAHPGAAPVTGARVLADGVTVARRTFDPPTDRPATLTLPLALLDGPNRVEVEAVDAAGRRSHRALARAAYRDPRQPTLWFIGFGVSQYRDPAIRDLRFAHRDVHDLALRFARARGFARVVSRGFTDHEVTDDAFEAARVIIARAAPRDTVVLFVSGHGVHAEGPDGAYHYLTHDARLDAIAETALPFDRIEDLIEATPARRRLMLLDTCESGERLPGDALTLPADGAIGPMHARVLPGQRLIRPVIAAPALAPVDPRDRFIDRDLRRRTGAVVFSSSRGTEASWELERLENGAFTEALLDAIGGAADADGDGWLTVDELRAHVAAAVPRLTGDRQHPVIDRDNPAARIRLSVIAPR